MGEADASSNNVTLCCIVLKMSEYTKPVGEIKMSQGKQATLRKYCLKIDANAYQVPMASDGASYILRDNG